MTNVPNDIREIWREVYILFDTHYLMPNTAESWTAFWDDANKLYEKYGKNELLIGMLVMASSIIEHRMKQEQKEGEADGNRQYVPGSQM